MIAAKNLYNYRLDYLIGPNDQHLDQIALTLSTNPYKPQT